jgi:hypothetical protein
MTVGALTKKNEHIIFDENYIKNDSQKAVEFFVDWCSKYPYYELEDGDYEGNTILMRAMQFGNVTLTKYLVSEMDKNSLNAHSANGVNCIAFTFLSCLNKNINKLLKCVKIVIKADIDIHQVNIHEKTPLDVLIDNEDWQTLAAKLKPMIKLLIRSGFQCSGYKPNTVFLRRRSPLYKQAQEAIQKEKDALLEFDFCNELREQPVQLPRKVVDIIVKKYLNISDFRD